MNDCYRILGVPPSATAAQIRAAYLAKMKRLHPDARPDAAEAQVTASEVTYAYWQLRDPARRAEHDGRLRPAAPVPRPKVPANSKPKPRPRRAQLSLRARARRSARLQPVRAAAGALAFAVAAAGFAIAFTLVQPNGAIGARAAGLVEPGRSRSDGNELGRRVLDPEVAAAAAGEFRSILKGSGPEGAYVYARQCLAQLVARPTLSMLDYCLAFDQAAAKWESQVAGLAPRGRLFDEQQRFGRYLSVSQAVREPSVREALLGEVDFLADPASEQPLVKAGGGERTKAT